MSEQTVYVVQEQPGRNILSAQEYGTIKVMLPPWGQIIFSVAPAVRQLKDHLKNFSDDDYILAMGDPTAIGIACSVAAKNNNGRYKVLKWDRQESQYYVVQVVL